MALDGCIGYHQETAPITIRRGKCSHVDPPRISHRRRQAHPGGRRCPPAPRLRLRRLLRDRSLPAVRRFPERAARGLPGGLSLAPAPRHRDDHLRAGWIGGTRGQSWQQWRAERGRRPVDDGGAGDHAPRNAQGRPDRPDARLPALGQPAIEPEDDRAPVPGCAGQRHPHGQRRRRHRRAGGVRRVLGEAGTSGRHCRGSAVPGCLRAAR